MNYVRKYSATGARQPCLPPRPPGAHHGPDPDSAPSTPIHGHVNSVNISFNSYCFLLLPA
ncbi:hypothetical protein E2C01_058518 [Portunus trituberculatus]|uniref:Uncharacterized protein n=1 Tax=Portunus trituberculatus TaxID=210409 RepID=A0A5B7H2X3_PORTR|nr:hypothetical protein [Portunus trituberculatus]